MIKWFLNTRNKWEDPYPRMIKHAKIVSIAREYGRAWWQLFWGPAIGKPRMLRNEFFLRLHKMEGLCGQRHIAGSPDAPEVKWLVATMEGRCGLLTWYVHLPVDVVLLLRKSLNGFTFYSNGTFMKGCVWESVDFRADNTSFRYLERLRDVEVGRTQEEERDVAVHWWVLIILTVSDRDRQTDRVEELGRGREREKVIRGKRRKMTEDRGWGADAHRR